MSMLIVWQVMLVIVCFEITNMNWENKVCHLAHFFCVFWFYNVEIRGLYDQIMTNFGHRECYKKVKWLITNILSTTFSTRSEYNTPFFQENIRIQK